MSLADRKATAKEESKKARMIPDDTYSVRLVEWKFGKSRKGQDMYTFVWKIIEGEQKGKKRNTYYVVSNHDMFDKLTDHIEAMGANLEKMNNIPDIDTFLEDVEDTRMPKAKMKHEQKEGDQFPNITISDIEQVIWDEDDDEDEEETPPPTKKRKTAPKKTAKKKPEPEPEPEPEDVDEDDEDDEVEVPD